MELHEIYQEMRDDMLLIEKELYQAIERSNSSLAEPALHLLKAGGKRLRPLFVLLSGCLGNYRLEHLKLVAVPLELIHMATLVHDDIIDDADLRRGQPTVRAKWDNQIALYTGDFILAQALQYISQLKEARVHQILSQALVQMGLGEIYQLRDFFNVNQHLRQYLQRIKRKTALLISVSCQLGGQVSQLPAHAVQKLYLFGYYAGMAFQITDDLLDLIGDRKTTGKPHGSDVRQGNITLPLIYALNQSESRSQVLPLIRQIQEITSSSPSRAESAHQLDHLTRRLIQIVKEAGGIQYAETLANRYLIKAKNALSSFPPSRERERLIHVADAIARRQY
ncbi:MAG: heptaprenyl diphosphate synthase [Bacillus thermozeamaize]|jgi:heptaprenyl diphosphate synthase|uniref:Heptaprenyl diphosphate synthase n=1 Tax=Bacillus thermozeamaize TaxID=230954 RepID=A0A1Y3PUB2_9BACI|nr:MAG: heptaprenyl diphosphate synthase [Bacillus thermozeamaize]